MRINNPKEVDIKEIIFIGAYVVALNVIFVVGITTWGPWYSQLAVVLPLITINSLAMHKLMLPWFTNKD